MSASDVPLADTLDDPDDDFSDEDVDSDYETCESFVSDGTVEDVEELEILQFDTKHRKWEPVQARDVQDLVGPSTEWVSVVEQERFIDTVINCIQRCWDTMAVLSETVGGVAEEWWHDLLSYQKRPSLMHTHFCGLQMLVFLIMSSQESSADIVWWRLRELYIPSRKMLQLSFASNLFEGRIVIDYSPDRPSKDFAEAMRILLPYFREMKVRLDTLSSNVGHSSDSASILGPSNLANLIMCLDVAESVAKLVPVFGDVLEGACGILRKTVEAADKARAARDECRALAEHTTSITLAILHEIGPAPTLSGGDFNRICDLRETIKLVHSRVQSLSKLGRTKYFFSRGRINTELMELRAKVDNARIAFNIRNDISTARLLADLRNMQIHLASRVEDIYEGQQTTHHMLRTILVEVKGQRSGGAFIDEADD